MNSAWKVLSRAELEKEVSPSRWNPNKGPEDVIQEYVAVSTEATAAARASIPHDLNVPYGTKPTQVFDLYGTDLPKDSPAFAYIHGGFWQEGSKDLAGGIAMLNHKIGIRTLVIGYTLAPNGKLADMVTEVGDALLVFFKTNQETKLIVGGHSAGGHLTASLLHSTSLAALMGHSIAGVVFIAGVFDLRPLVPTYVNGVLNLSRNEAKAMSPLLQPFNDVVNFMALRSLFLIGEFDSPEFRRQSEAYFDKLKAQASICSNLYSSAGDDHFTLVQNLAEESSWVAGVLKSFLDAFLPTPPAEGA